MRLLWITESVRAGGKKPGVEQEVWELFSSREKKREPRFLAARKGGREGGEQTENTAHHVKDLFSYRPSKSR